MPPALPMLASRPMVRVCCTLAMLHFSSALPAKIAGNPFALTTWYVNPANQREIDSSIKTASGAVKQTLTTMRGIPSAYWIDKKSKINGQTTDTLEGILADAASKLTAPLVAFIIYNLPNRDCDAGASNGEICCTTAANSSTCDYMASGACEDGLNEYKHLYIDPIAAVLTRYAKRIPMAIIIEPDSLPNLATNTGVPGCGNAATHAAYTQGVSYAVNTLKGAAPSAAIYLDAAHGGWLGWQNNARKYATLVASLGITQHLRGFTSNVANYQALGAACPPEAFTMGGGLPQYCKTHKGATCCADPCHLLSQYNFGNGEYNYVQLMTSTVAGVTNGWTPHWLIDTGRNGVADERSDCSDWCNIRNAGAGRRPTTNTSLPSLVDALFWLKTPGESDGCTQTLPDGSACPRFDPMCATPDAIGSRSGEPRAPAAGAWFDYQVKQLAQNAKLDSMPPAVHTSPPIAAVSAFAAPFGNCYGDSDPCLGGYYCHGAVVEGVGVCMPTAATIASRGQNAVFNTALEHALHRSLPLSG